MRQLLPRDGEALRAEILAGDSERGWIKSWANYYRLAPPREDRQGAQA